MHIHTTYRFLLVILLICSGCDSNSISDPKDPPEPIDYNSRFDPKLTNELFAFVANFGSDSSKVGIAPISIPGSFEFIDKHEIINAPRFNSSKSRLAYSVSRYHSQAGYLIESDSTYRFPLSDRGYSHTITWINEDEYVHSSLISSYGLDSHIRNTASLNSSYFRGDLKTVGANLLPEGMLVWDNTDFRNGGKTFYGVFDFETGETEKKTWLSDTDYPFFTSSAADYEPESNNVVAEVRSSATGEWALKVVNLDTGITGVFKEIAGYKFSYPRWVSSEKIIYVRVSQSGTFAGRQIRILDTQNGFTNLLLSVTSIEGATSLAFPDY